MSKGSPSAQEIICVLGMHRSGTSLITRVLNLLGVYLGPEEHLMAPNTDNPKGFWEHDPFKRLNDEILEKLGGTWHEPPMFGAGWETSPELSELRKRARALIQDDFASAELWGWKDPRLCLTLPFWQRLLPSMKYVICLRNPVDVARSLEVREGFSLEKGIDLWLTHVVSALEHTAGQQRSMVFYEDFMADWNVELRRLGEFLKKPEAAEEEKIQKAVKESVDEELHHYRTSFIDTADEARLSFPAKALHAVLRIYNKPGGTERTRKGFDAATGRVLDVFARYAGESREELRALASEAIRLGEALETERETAARIVSDRDGLVEETARLRERAEQLNLALERTQEEIVQASAAREALTREIDHLRADLSRETEEHSVSMAALKAALRNERDLNRRLLADKEAAIFHRDSRIRQLETVQTGLFWDLLSAYRGAKDRYLPAETRRRALYDWSLETVKGFKGGGRSFGKIVFLPIRHPLRTWQHFNVTNAKKLLYDFRYGNYGLAANKIERKLFGELPIVEIPPRVVLRSQKFCLIMSGCPGDAYRYRCEHHAEQLRFLGLAVDSTFFDQVDYRTALESYQVFWLHRVPHTEDIEAFIKAAQQTGKPVIFDTDDLVFDEEKIPYIRALKWMSQSEVDLYYDGVRRYHRTLSRCRLATVTTEPLRRAVQRILPHMRCLVIPNVLSDIQVAQAQEALAQARPAEDDGIVRIAYFSGTHTHNVDFKECSPALVRGLEAFPQVRVMLVGHLDVGGEFARFEDRVERHPLMPWQDLPRLLRRVDINLAPLEPENPFTECKSSLKYFEAGLLGVPTVASDVEPYRQSIIHGENGYLCRTAEDWYQCISRLVQDAALRREMGLMARTDVLKNCTTRTASSHLREVLKEIVSTSAHRWRAALKINFILRAPIAQVGGGYKVAFLLAHDLARRGHHVRVYVEAIAHLEGKSDSEIIAFCHEYFGDSPAQIHVGHDSISECDVAIATNWPTAFVVADLPNALCKLYLIQDFEPEFYEAQSSLYKEVEKTYELPLRKVAIGRYLAGLFAEKERLPVSYFPFGIDHAVFHAGDRKPFPSVRVLFFARPALKRRGFPVGVEALARVYEKCPEIEIRLYGMEEAAKLPFPYTHLGLLDQSQLAKAMRESDIHLSFSFSNISQVPFQAMACGCAVVEAKVPSVDAMVEDGTNCLLAEPEPEAVAAVVFRLIQDEELRRGIAARGLESVRELTWENSCKQFESILFESVLLDPANARPEDSGAVNFSWPVATAAESPVSGRGIFYRSCNFCGSTRFRVFKQFDVPFPDRIYGDQELTYPDVGRHLKLQYLECTSCGLVGINPLTQFADINRNSFDGERNIVAWADLKYDQYEAEKLSEIKIVYTQYEFEKYRKNNRVLDVSCGPGVSLNWLQAEKGWEVFGVDPDRYSVRMAWNRYGIRIANGLIQDIQSPEEHFDLIIMDNSLEHTFDPLSALLSAFRLLRKGGGVFIFTPNCHGLSTKYLNQNAHWGHWFLYPPAGLYKILRRIGYEVPLFHACQNPINQELIDHGIDIEPYRKGLAVSLIGADAVEAQIEIVPMVADFFNLIAVKPAESEVASQWESDLAKIAQFSLEQREAVSIAGARPASSPSMKDQSSEDVADGKAFAGSVLPEKIFYRRCNFCGATRFRVFKRLEVPFPDRIYGDQELTYPDVGKRLKLQYLECTGCGLVGINPLTRFADINRNSFDGERNIVAWADLDYGWYEEDKLKTIGAIYDQYRFEEYRKNNRVLDVSCGPGVSLRWLRDEKGWEVYGVDPDLHAVRTARQRYGIRVENGLIDDLRSPDEYFDLIVMDNSLEHTFDPLSTLLSAFRLLRKGGGLFIATPNCHGLSTKYLNANAHWGHWFLYSPKTLCDILSRIGFKVSRIFAVQETVDQAIIDQGCDIEPYRDGLRVSLPDEHAVAARIGQVAIYSDYFHIMTLKPLGSGPRAASEAELSAVARYSLEQIRAVSIIEEPPS
jgi:2-polyprenyl-3-methyl-5-hydroxy-6-metoxy-1,4-benzoquinol methylase